MIVIKKGLIYFYIHMILEIVCFFYLSRVTNNSIYIWIVPFIYDALAFVPQSIIGYIVDKNPKINIGIIGTILLIISILLYSLTNINIFVSLIILSIGNACVHVSGAENTLRISNGKLSPVSIFVSGGSFGVVLGRVLSRTSINPLLLLIPLLTLIPLLLKPVDNEVENYNYVKDNINPTLVIFIGVLVVTIRSYMGYGIPTSWNKTVSQTILLFFIMGIGKALGGILSDLIGIKKVALISTLLSIPFLVLGNNSMYISLIGIMLFSMTMAVTLGILVSKLRKTPGFAFGLTTIGLFLGSLPMFFVKFNMDINIIIIIVLGLISAFGLTYVLKGDKNE